MKRLFVITPAQDEKLSQLSKAQGVTKSAYIRSLIDGPVYTPAPKYIPSPAGPTFSTAKVYTPDKLTVLGQVKTVPEVEAWIVQLKKVPAELRLAVEELEGKNAALSASAIKSIPAFWRGVESLKREDNTYRSAIEAYLTSKRVPESETL